MRRNLKLHMWLMSVVLTAYPQQHGHRERTVTKAAKILP